MKAIHGECTDVRQIKSQGVARIYVEVPVECTKDVIAFALNERVLLTLSEVDAPFGLVNSDGTVVETENMARVGNGEFARKLHAHGFFRAPSVWKQLGSDDDYQAWCRLKNCAVCGGHPTVYAHVRRINRGAGVGIKPAYSGLPLCNDCHTTQHNDGESAVHSGGKDWFDKASMRYVEQWAHERLVIWFAADSLTDIEPATIIEWARAADLGVYLPRE